MTRCNAAAGCTADAQRPSVQQPRQYAQQQHSQIQEQAPGYVTNQLDTATRYSSQHKTCCYNKYEYA